jgi:hypothetical protein
MLQNKLLGGYFGEEILAFDYAGRTKKAQLIYRS